VFLHTVGEKREDARLFEALRKHRDWYVGDGMYGDGPEFHWDYYNAFVMHRRALARYARTIRQLEFGLRTLHALEQAGRVGCGVRNAGEPRPSRRHFWERYAGDIAAR
jgi:hypothetical protein